MKKKMNMKMKKINILKNKMKIRLYHYLINLLQILHYFQYSSVLYGNATLASIYFGEGLLQGEIDYGLTDKGVTILY
ncbi:MAG: hypothetical protein EZS28_005086 [Streblomastix strix]|uniref:Uncharacterized protein n=1 Tax=Streblomastix strix TaxID=222440 RepID=A0A5J4WYV2_9EUKA|nr:MAG: hypothetical protein EZS28_005086 [Streblomastix strix]